MLYIPRFRLFRRSQNATPEERAAVLAGVVDLFRLPIEDELCAPAEAVAADAEKDAAADGSAVPSIGRLTV